MPDFTKECEEYIEKELQGMEKRKLLEKIKEILERKVYDVMLSKITEDNRMSFSSYFKVKYKDSIREQLIYKSTDEQYEYIWKLTNEVSDELMDNYKLVQYIDDERPDPPFDKEFSMGFYRYDD